MSSEGEEDDSSKTEDPSEKKLADALEKGQVAHSNEVNSFFILLLLTIVICFSLPFIFVKIGSQLRFLIENSGNINVDNAMLGIIFWKYISLAFIYLSPILCISTIVAIISAYAQHGAFIFTFEQMKPSLDKLSPIKGFTRIVSTKSLIEFLKGIFKITLVGSFVYLVILNDIKELSQYQELSVGGILQQLFEIIKDIFILSTIIAAAIAAVDYSYQQYAHFNKLKMTKQEVKEEYKQMQGNPEIKQKIRSLRMEQSQKVLSQTVPKATVVITNPDHYAVALRYVKGETSAPICVAKGLDLIAESIKKLAKNSDIPIVENKPLARALYKDVKIKQEIKTEYYEAVAEIIGYVESLNNRRKEQNKKPI